MQSLRKQSSMSSSCEFSPAPWRQTKGDRQHVLLNLVFDHLILSQRFSAAPCFCQRKCTVESPICLLSPWSYLPDYLFSLAGVPNIMLTEKHKQNDVSYAPSCQNLNKDKYVYLQSGRGPPPQKKKYHTLLIIFSSIMDGVCFDSNIS